MSRVFLLLIAALVVTALACGPAQAPPAQEAAAPAPENGREGGARGREGGARGREGGPG